MNTIAETHKPHDSGAGGRRGTDSSLIGPSDSSLVVEMPPLPANLRVTSPLIRYKASHFHEAPGKIYPIFDLWCLAMCLFKGMDNQEA